MKLSITGNMLHVHSYRSKLLHSCHSVHLQWDCTVVCDVSNVYFRHVYKVSCNSMSLYSPTRRLQCRLAALYNLPCIMNLSYIQRFMNMPCTSSSHMQVEFHGTE